MLKQELESTVLAPCRVCGGRGKWEEFVFNPASPVQVKMLLYEALGLPRRFNEGKLSTDENALRGLLGGL